MASDRDLLVAYLGGSEEAFAAFFDRHTKALYVYLLSLVHFREVAEELLQDTFLKLIPRAEALELRPDMRPFLFTTARNLALDWLRREKRSRLALRNRHTDPFFRRICTGTEDYGDDSPDLEELSQVLHRLPEAQREAVVLKELVGLTFVEIGELVGSPENTVVSRYRYAMEKLRSLMLARGWSNDA